MTLQTVDDFKRLPGVVDVKPAHPQAGYVTLVVAPRARGIARVIDPGRGDGTGEVPIGMVVLEEDEVWT